MDPQKQLEQDEKVVTLVRIIARGIGPVLFLIMLIMAFGEGGLDRLISMNSNETIIFVGILTMFFGIIWAYQNEIAGGILIVLTYIVLAIVKGSIFPDAIFPIFLIVGILNIYIWLMKLSIERRKKQDSRSKN